VKGRLLALATFAAAALAAVGCGGAGSASSVPTLKWYVFAEPSGAFAQAAKDCTQQANGRYRVAIVDLPTNADQQRELVVRRLAAKDSDIDIVGMDVIWTAEFAQAGWIKPWTGENAAKARKGVLTGPLKTAEYKGQLWTAPLTTNTQLLWYRKDRVDKPPKTWDEMIAQAQKIGADGKIQVQAARYEGLTVWFNSLDASAGGQIVNEQGDPVLGPPAVRAAEVMKNLASSSAVDPSLSNNREDQARLGFESGGSSFQVNYTFVYASAKKGAKSNPATKKVFENMGWAEWPRVAADKPSRVTLGGINLGIGSYSKHPALAFEAALCLVQPDNQVIAAEKGGLPPTSTKLYDDPRIKKTFPFAVLLRQTLDRGVARPVSPAYSDISLAIQKSLHPPKDIDPPKAIDDLGSKLNKVKRGGIF
jgi:trehalose/maltose transport system substrate-binding protein